MADAKQLSPQDELAQLLARKQELEEELDKSTWSDERWSQEAKKIMDKLKKEWPQGMKWLEMTQSKGRKSCVVVSPIKRRRHLFGYLHNDRGIIAKANRRGPNSSIQGFASDLGFFSGWLCYDYFWKAFRRQQLPYYAKQLMAVHDSMTWEMPLIETAFTEYIIEHAMSTMLERFLKKVFDLDTVAMYDNDAKFGVNQDDVSNWNFRTDGMLDLIKKYGEKRGETTKEIDKALHDTNIIYGIREAELKQGYRTPASIKASTAIEQLSETYMVKRLVVCKGDQAKYHALCGIG